MNRSCKRILNPLAGLSVVTCYNFLSSSPYFPLHLLISRGSRTFHQVDLKFPAHVSHGARDFISRLLRKNPSQRLSLEGVLTHPWLVESAKDARL